MSGLYLMFEHPKWILRKRKMFQGLSNSGDMNMKLIYQHMQPLLGYVIDLRQNVSGTHL